MSLTKMTTREQTVLLAAVQYCLANPAGLKIDYKLLAEHGGFNGNVDSARSAWNKIRRTYFEGGKTNSPTSNETPKSNEFLAVNSHEKDSDSTQPVNPPKKRTRKPKDPNAPPTKRARKAKPAPVTKKDPTKVEGGKSPVSGNYVGNEDIKVETSSPEEAAEDEQEESVA
ncbi:uncharacterized protein KY384_001838 [Bacidia gigantensis]|uniref:uncharacterized protein n=1 Tax=Bacidia gigantensis TaxID=2732470 RepID=UPI001D037EA3|nr:uncharacterized protein KY384_001838 [Bacidia gigantensis]KAG8533055.1 hypothetical protein KY384_001838 [Bacidia gigantensis]